MDREAATPHLDPSWGAEYVGGSNHGAVFRDKTGELFVIVDKGNAVGRVPFHGNLRGPEDEPPETETGPELAPETTVVAEEEPAAEAPAPERLAVNRWKLLDGSVFKGTKAEAIEAQAALAAEK